MSVKSDLRTLFCVQNSLSQEQFSSVVLRRVAYGHAYWPLKVLGLFYPNFLQADYDFIDNVGRIRRFREYEQTVREYFDHPMNRNNSLRHILMLRISTARMRRLVRNSLRPDEVKPQ